MKKIILFFAGLLLLTTLSCDNEDPIVYPEVTGVWKPVQMVKTVVNNVNAPTSETFLYGDCQQESRWEFREDGTGKILWRVQLNPTSCTTAFEQNLQYDYNNSNGDIVINYITHQERGKAMDITETSMNLKIETINADTQVYESQVYTLVKVQ
ncbi:lipocalin family protein [Chryseobacterium lacus]|uniref:lipocalin family protein n=1 Tax=Chryseobacterium lacus TaxID=2058346 RepID=UPI00086E5785|nr:lipocalin family protein [Chryseobacterium lacus]ODS87808.1 MAG: hypothetical protein ABS44_09985 [Chryseobacterium sp. SCN 40-13]RST29323.1 hypothetical protein EIZ46_01255 [Chryseobacterium lacus]